MLEVQERSIHAVVLPLRFNVPLLTPSGAHRRLDPRRDLRRVGGLFGARARRGGRVVDFSWCCPARRASSRAPLPVTRMPYFFFRRCCSRRAAWGSGLPFMFIPSPGAFYSTFYPNG